MWLIIQLSVLLLVCMGLIIYSGSRISFYADNIAEHTKLGRTLVGVILLAGITSLPELTTGIVSVTATVTPDIAIGAILGSCVFNIVILALIDPLNKKIPLLSCVDTSHIITVAFSMIMISVVLLGQMLSEVLPALAHVGIYSILLFVLYFTCIRITATFLKSNKHVVIVPEVRVKYDLSMRFITIHFIKHSVIIVLVAGALPFIGEKLSEIAGIGQTFIGSALIAVITSSPEIVVSIAAIRLNAVDLAMGNLLGSNIFNLLIIAIADVFFLHGPILENIETEHIFSGITAIIFSAIIIIAMVVRSQIRRLFISNISWLIIILYSVYIGVLYLLTK